MPGGQVIGIRRHKYAVLLALLVVGLAVATFTAQSGFERLRSDAVRTVLGVATWIVVLTPARAAHHGGRPFRGPGDQFGDGT